MIIVYERALFTHWDRNGRLDLTMETEIEITELFQILARVFTKKTSDSKSAKARMI